MSADNPVRRPRALVAFLAVVTVPLGLLTRADLPLPGIIVTYGGDTLYATMAFFLAALVLPHWPTWRLVVLALAFCYAIELSQLLQAPGLDTLRATRVGRLVLGAGFLWSDLVCYAVGVLLGAVIDWLVVQPRGAR